MIRLGGVKGVGGGEGWAGKYRKDETWQDRTRQDKTRQGNIRLDYTTLD